MGDKLEFIKQSANSLDYITAHPNTYNPAKHYPMIILLHGYGSNMKDLAPLSGLISSEGYIFVFPNAPNQLMNEFGPEAFSWSNFNTLGDTENPEFIKDAENTEFLLNNFLEEVTAKYKTPKGQIILGGFSQGGMVTYLWGLKNPDVFCGLASLSSKMILPDYIESNLPKKRSQKVFISHGSNDTIVPLNDGVDAAEKLKTFGYEPDYHEYQIGHEITNDVLYDLSNWVSNTLPPAKIS